MEEIKIEYLDITEIVPYENNPRFNDEAVEQVANSIKEFGFKVPIVIDENNVIVTGHTRHKASKKLGLTKVPCIRATDLTPEQIKAFRLADNKVSDLASWDLEKLEMELDEISMDMSEFGFDLEIDDIELMDDVKEDTVPEPPKEPKSKLGDVYALGNHRLICGDSTDELVLKKLMDGKNADMVFCDPPYGYNYQSNWREGTEKFDVIENDDKILDFFSNLVGRVTGFVMVCTTWKVLDETIPLFKKYFNLTNMIIWNKGGGGIGDLKHTFSTDYEIILCSNNGQELKGSRIGSVWNINRYDVNSYVHPTQKPIELPAKAITNTTKQGDIVLDVFGGSGSTLIACEQTKRKCYMCELDPKYVDVIIERWENLTGKKAKLLN